MTYSLLFKFFLLDSIYMIALHDLGFTDQTISSNMSFSARVNSLGNIVSVCQTSFFRIFFTLKSSFLKYKEILTLSLPLDVKVIHFK